MNTRRLFCYTFIIIILTGCGGSSSDIVPVNTTVPVSVNITGAPLAAAVPSTFSYTIPAPAEPYTDVIIDLAKTLESANITVIPATP